PRDWLRHGIRDLAARHFGRRGGPTSPALRADLLTADLRRRDVVDGHGGWRVHVPRLLLGILEPGAEGFLQPDDDRTVGVRRALYRSYRGGTDHGDYAEFSRRSEEHTSELQSRVDL